MDRNTAIRYFNGLARALGPDNLGMPVDAAAQALNLGLAGVGYAGHKTGLLKEPLPLIDKPVGGSDWIAEKLGNADDGSGAYTAGRITPMAAGLARMGGSGAAKLADKMLTQGPAARGRAAQRGAIRVSRGPGDTPDEELILSTSLNQELLPALMTKGGNAELYSPSMGIKRGQIMTEFGDLALIPKLGAFDPATSPSTLFNRDAYTARYPEFSGRIAAKALEPKQVELVKAAGGRNAAMRMLLSDPANVEIQGTPITEFSAFRPVLRQWNEAVEKLGPNAAWERLSALDPEHFDADAFDSMMRLSKQLDFTTTPQRGVRLPEAQLRMGERTALGIRPEDLRLNEGSQLGVPGGGNDNFWHTLAVRTSPAFRSFQAYERNPLGAGLLTRGYANEAGYQQKVRQAAFGDDFGWLDRAAQQAAVERVPRGLGDFKEALDPTVMGSDFDPILTSYRLNGLTGVDAQGEAAQLYKAAARARRGIQHTPSAYAELKVLGSVPINSDSFAGAILQDEPLPAVRNALNYLELPWMTQKQLNEQGITQLDAVNALQRGLAAPRQPVK